MIWYLVIAAALTFLALSESGQSSPIKPSGLLAAVILIMFAGLRYETGYDWLEYENYFQGIGTFQDNSHLLEPGFSILNRLVKMLGLPFQAVLLVIAAINIAVIYKLSVTFSSRPALVFLWMFGLVFLTGQMAAIRQVLGYSFIFVALLFAAKGKNRIALAVGLLSATCHAFSLVFVPFLFVKWPAPRTSIVVFSAVAGLAISFSGFQLWPLLSSFIAPILPGFLQQRLEFYGGADSFDFSPLAMLLLLWHIGALVLIRYARSGYSARAPDDSFYRFCIWATLLSVFAHTWLAAFPGAWNRIMLVSMIVQIIELCRSFAPEFQTRIRSLAIVAGISAASTGALVLLLSRPQSLPYTPYQFAPAMWISGQTGDGRHRYLLQLRESSEDIARNRSQ